MVIGGKEYMKSERREESGKWVVTALRDQGGWKYTRRRIRKI